MRLLILSIIGSFLLAFPCEAGLVGFFTKQRRDWKFIQSVGGMKVHLVEKRLVVACDISGTKKITTEPKTVNSGIGVRKLICSREGYMVQLAVVTSVIEKGMKSTCGSIDISKFPSGPYSVVYLNRDGTCQALGKIQLP